MLKRILPTIAFPRSRPPPLSIQPLSRLSQAAMKRKQPASTKPSSAAKKPRTDNKDYCATPPLTDDAGQPIWPAPADEMRNARAIITACAAANATAVICPDKDADGLASGAILHRTLRHLGLPAANIHVHLLPKGTTIHAADQRAALAALLPAPPAQSYLFILDHGTATSPALADPAHTTTLVIDHHFSTPTSFPLGAAHVNASHCPPVATTSLLTHTLCAPLFPALASPELAWLAALGTHGDLGTALAWRAPFPDMAATFAAHKRSAINTGVSLVNAPRRTATYDVRSAWDALLAAASPGALLAGPGAARLRDARAEVNAEVSRWQAAAPSFAADGSVAVLRVASAAQVHPVIATRWAGTLRSKRLRVVLCANTAYLEGRVNFSCRVAGCARERVAAGEEEDVDIIAELKRWAGLHESGDLLERLGSEFARGHVQASGGVVGAREFEELMEVLRVGERAPAKGPGKTGASPAKKVIDRGQTNTLGRYFGKK